MRLTPGYTTLSIFLFLVISYQAIAQNFRGKVIDATTLEPLAYSNIIVPGRNIGGISSAAGEYSIDLSKTQRTDSVRFSYLGYEAATLAIASFDLSLSHVIKLKPKPVVLESITVFSNIEMKKLGNRKAGPRMTGWGDFESLKGRTRGLLIEGAECPVKVRSFSFKLAENEWDSVAFRLNFLNVVDNMPAESLLQQNIFITATKGKGWVHVDLSHYNIAICKRVIATLEWVDAWGKTREFSNVLTIALSKASGYSFIREAGYEKGVFEIEEQTPAFFIEVHN